MDHQTKLARMPILVAPPKKHKTEKLCRTPLLGFFYGRFFYGQVLRPVFKVSFFHMSEMADKADIAAVSARKIDFPNDTQ